MNFYQFIIPRLNGRDIEKDFDYYRRLVKKGIAGFIIFGGKLDTVRKGIKELQREAKKPLIIASDLEQGLGQQIEGGTIFPPAMAIASAITPPHPPLGKGGIKGGWSSKLKLLRDTFEAIAIEAGYAGINTILAPVLDINTNPKNPIISTRSFGEEAETVSFFGCEMIKILQSNGIASCCKHFPGHGDTEIDSHIGLPLIKKDLQLLKKTELVPFRDAIKHGVKMIMLGHLKVPALEPSGIPVSLSAKAVRYLRDKMKFQGIIITDALNMGGINWGNSSKSLKSSSIEERASLMALGAGVDLLLHPTDVEKIVSYLEKNRYRLKLSTKHLALSTKIDTSHFPPPTSYFERHKKLSEELTRKSIKIIGQERLIKKPLLVILNDDIHDDGKALLNGLKLRHRAVRSLRFKTGDDIRLGDIKKDKEIIVAVFSSIKAWKGGPSPWLIKCMKELESRAKIFVSFGSPYLFDEIRDEITKIYAYWDSDSAQKAVAEVI